MFEYRELEEPQPFTDAEQKAIDDLKQLFNENTDINFQTDNFFLTKFLRYRDWNAQAAYESIVKYYELKVNSSIVNICISLYCAIDLKDRIYQFRKLKNGFVLKITKNKNLQNRKITDTNLKKSGKFSLFSVDPLTVNLCCEGAQKNPCKL